MIFSEDGYIGDPTGASPELGEKLFNAAVESLCEALSEIKSFKFRVDDEANSRRNSR